MKNVIRSSPFKLEQFLVTEFRIKRKPIKSGEITFEINPSGRLDRKSKFFTLELGVKIADENGSFDIDISAMGLFKFKNKLPDGELNNYFYVNAPAIIFPYIRAYISTVTALSGLHAVNLPVLNLTDLQERLKNQTVEA